MNAAMTRLRLDMRRLSLPSRATAASYGVSTHTGDGASDGLQIAVLVILSVLVGIAVVMVCLRLCCADSDEEVAPVSRGRAVDYTAPASLAQTQMSLREYWARHLATVAHHPRTPHAHTRTHAHMCDGVGDRGGFRGVVVQEGSVCASDACRCEAGTSEKAGAGMGGTTDTAVRAHSGLDVHTRAQTPVVMPSHARTHTRAHIQTWPAKGPPSHTHARTHTAADGPEGMGDSSGTSVGVWPPLKDVGPDRAGREVVTTQNEEWVVPVRGQQG